MAAGCAALSVAASPGCSSNAAAIASVCPPGKTCQTRLTLLHTSDVHSRLLPYDLLVTQVDGDLGLGTTGTVKNVGGAARMAYVLGRERARADRVLHLDSGDCFQGAPIFNFYSGEPEVRAVSLFGTDAQVLGNHDFDRGAINAARQYQRWGAFPVLAANYKFDDARLPNSTLVSTVLQPFTVINREGLKVAVIGMGNISTLTSVFDQPNKTGILPLNTIETAQGYIDLLRPYVDVVVMLTHLGLEVDQRMVRGTTGIDVVLGGHNHVVINPPQSIQDCSADPENPGYVWAVLPDPDLDPNNPVYDPKDVNHLHPNAFPRPCSPRRVTIAHSGAFAKYVGRLDLVLSNDPAEAAPAGGGAYDPVNGFEVLSTSYTAFPVDDSVPEDPVMVEMLQPYRRALDLVADLDILVGFSPDGAKRTAPQGGDAPLGNLVATAAWLRLGVQTDFSLTNTTGIRADLNPGPITIEEMYNIFPFDNSISKMQLSGLEVQQLFDYVARRSGSRGCVAQAQIAGARVRLNCDGCSRPDHQFGCSIDTDCPAGTRGACDLESPPFGGFSHQCRQVPCAEEVYIGQQLDPQNHARSCNADDDCASPMAPGDQCLPANARNGKCVHVGQCFKPTAGQPGTCQATISTTNLYELATSNYLAGGGSGYRVLQRNTTQFDTLIQQRDALIDYLRQGPPCGYDRTIDPQTGQAKGQKACSVDADCGNSAFVCACPAHADADRSGGGFTCKTSGQCDPGQGRCVLAECRDQVAQFHERTCAGSPEADRCRLDLNACSMAGEECKLLSCVDANIGNLTDNRLEMIGR